ncbi:nuclear transport factor 2 family protein [Amycolatopsis pithecellobii]|nr:nuclear transport factor 2 family protein [Amycolatopsis pithecellobii]
MADQQAEVRAHDVVAVTGLIGRERQARDRRWWSEMGKCFHPDSIVELSWFTGSGAEFVASSEVAARGPVSPVHHIGLPVVRFRGDRAVAEVPATITSLDSINGVPVDLTSNIRILYRLQAHDSGWLIHGLHAIYERDTVAPVEVGAVLDLREENLGRFRRPYRYLAFLMSLRGITVGEGLYGDDQPDRVEALYTAAFEWLRG